MKPKNFFKKVIRRTENEEDIVSDKSFDNLEDEEEEEFD